MTDPIVSIPLDDLRAVLPFRANDDVRYYLNGINIEPYDGGALLAATNGHVMAMFHSKAARIDKARILDVKREFADAMRDQTGRFGELTLTVQEEGARAIIAGADGERYVKAGAAFIDGKFPDWRKVLAPVDHLKQGLLGAIAPQYLALIKRAMPKVQNRQSVRFWHDERRPAEAACYVRYGGMPELVVVIMPMAKHNDYEWPAWMPREPKPAEIVNVEPAAEVAT